MKNLFLLFAIFYLGTSSSSAQIAGGGINFIIGMPQKEFKENVGRNGYGLGIEALYYLTPAIPLGIGVNLGFLNYGNETRNAPLSTTIPDITVRVDRSNNIGNFHLLFRLTQNFSNFSPYLDLLLGGSYFYTETKVVNRSNNQEFASDKNFEDWAFSYGYGGGVMINIFNSKDETTGRVIPIFLDIKGRYLLGSEAEYLSEKDFIVNNLTGAVSYRTRISTTDLLNIQVGVSILF
ncbi:MAG: hypothetical protein C0425_10700 [Chlorobiaceae bacterium]|nr:hypothetical protein [Chlorobiaceae bacterium]MBA4310785.1 hypothetical protein [Chlorobiaceae bacterium]